MTTGQLDRDLSAGARAYSARRPVAYMLDPYRGIIDARLQTFPKLSAKRLFDEVRSAGYAGSYKRVQEYVRTTWAREPVDPVVQFETPAGRQGQGDFGTFTLPWGWRHALVIVLDYPAKIGRRRAWRSFCNNADLAALRRLLDWTAGAAGTPPERSSGSMH